MKVAAALPFTRRNQEAVAFSDLDYFTSETAFLANLGTRVTGTPEHNVLIDHIKGSLELLGLPVYAHHLNFTYNDQLISPPKLVVNNAELEISSYLPYSGNTDFEGLTGELVDLTGSNVKDINWARAKGKIAVVNITGGLQDYRDTLAPWAGQPDWYVATGIPPTVADARVGNLTQARQAGVKAVIHLWENISTGSAFGQYTPFKRLFQDMPSVFVAGQPAMAVKTAIKENTTATLTLQGKLHPNTTTRTIYTVFAGNKYPNETVIINTHTDGTNALEENGYIAIMSYARHLLANPPKRTTVLVFLTGHMHQPAFSTRGRAMRRWLDDHIEFWSGGDGNNMTAVASTCVEHLGALEWAEDLSNDTYFPTGRLADEILYANTPETLAILQQHWNGAREGFLRVSNPIPKGLQFGEGQPLTDVGIPNIALVTSPLYTVAEMPRDFDERKLIDIPAMKRQVDSFFRVWADMDTLERDAFGIVPPMVRPA
ncbi:hypothetical protein LTR84_009686 [Exophiala bonariae]|uniref:Peptide hydrolase n=1 Tax=Exophiala bonariae TaxID=1690606 RepID=A0AAV9NLF2_9EURO|nr:hypothetical protein LTR84_009686 [Exophiala bonariae]